MIKGNKIERIKIEFGEEKCDGKLSEMNKTREGP